VRVIVPDVGGGFGAKIAPFADDGLLGVIAKALLLPGRFPVVVGMTPYGRNGLGACPGPTTLADARPAPVLRHAHALEAASLYTVRHGDAVALGLLAAMRLSGLPTDVVETVLDPRPVAVDRERAWAALQRDKKIRDGRIRLVLLEAPGKPAWGIERPEAEVRAALDELTTG
jgi:hypothetical protein